MLFFVLSQERSDRATERRLYESKLANLHMDLQRHLAEKNEMEAMLHELERDFETTRRRLEAALLESNHSATAQEGGGQLETLQAGALSTVKAVERDP